MYLQREAFPEEGRFRYLILKATTMKKIAIILSAVLLTFASQAQDAQSAAAKAAKAISEAPVEKAQEAKPVYWTKSAKFDFGFNQTGLWNWAAGGYKTITFVGSLDSKANYAKDLTSWNNRLQLQYGFLWSEDKSSVLQKNSDLLYLESKFAFNVGTGSKWSYTASLDFRTQFSQGFKSYDETGGVTPLSNFFAPAYLNLALGMQWKPNNWFDMNIAPLTGGIVFCSDPSFRSNYGMPRLDDGTYKGALFQFGAQLKANAKFVFNDVISFETQLVIFTDYLSHPFTWNRINWDNKFNWKLSKLFNLGLSTWLIYDPIVTINDRTSLVQFKEFFTLSFSYTIASK